jgi:hypothetical protein
LGIGYWVLKGPSTSIPNLEYSVSIHKAAAGSAQRRFLCIVVALVTAHLDRPLNMKIRILNDDFHVKLYLKLENFY